MKERTLTGKTRPKSRTRLGRARLSHRAAGAGRIGAVAWTFSIVLLSFALALATQTAGR
ncbi:MAG: hypothetical protein ACREOU_12020 [Candidatus Eiseniibacteriota bacterium]